MSVAKSSELKCLETQLSVREGQLKSARLELQHAQDNVNNLMLVSNSLRERIKSLTVEDSGEITFTEHSMLRYLERVKGVDLQEIQDEMLTDRERKNALELGTVNIKRPQYTIVIQNRKVITIK